MTRNSRRVAVMDVAGEPTGPFRHDGWRRCRRAGDRPQPEPCLAMSAARNGPFRFITSRLNLTVRESVTGHLEEVPVVVMLLQKSVWNFSKMKRGRFMFLVLTCTGSTSFHRNTRSSVVHPSGHPSIQLAIVTDSGRYITYS